jgi:N-acetylmuramic acid 6-phosphate etherase
MLTEQSNSRSQHIDSMTSEEIIQTINEEDRTVADSISRALPQIAQAIDLIVERLNRGGRLIYVGAGTSGRLGMLDAVECVPTFGTAPELVQAIIAGGETALVTAVEGAEDDIEQAALDLADLEVNADDVVCGIAASGRTPYVIAAMNYASNVGAVTLGIACNDPAPLLQAVDVAIPVPVGPEVVTGSTRMKAGTAQKMVLNMLSTATMIRRGKVYGNLMVDLQITNQKLAHRARQIIEHLTGIDDEQAEALIKAADNDVKVAIVMAKRDVDAEQARELLQTAGGHLREVIDDA